MSTRTTKVWKIHKNLYISIQKYLLGYLFGTKLILYLIFYTIWKSWIILKIEWWFGKNPNTVDMYVKFH